MHLIASRSCKRSGLHNCRGKDMHISLNQILEESGKKYSMIETIVYEASIHGRLGALNSMDDSRNNDSNIPKPPNYPVVSPQQYEVANNPNI